MAKKLPRPSEQEQEPGEDEQDRDRPGDDPFAEATVGVVAARRAEHGERDQCRPGPEQGGGPDAEAQVAG